VPSTATFPTTDFELNHVAQTRFYAFTRTKIVHDKDINDSQGQDQEELMMK
jgi:hypothetical protein